MLRFQMFETGAQYAAGKGATNRVGNVNSTGVCGGPPRAGQSDLRTISLRGHSNLSKTIGKYGSAASHSDSFGKASLSQSGLQ
jgi:hypothetical protein